jgi:hypothetical protein
VKALRDAVIHAVLGVAGLLFGVLSAAALGIAAVIPPILGMLALLFSPLRALVDRFRRPAEAP